MNIDGLGEKADEQGSELVYEVAGELLERGYGLYLGDEHNPERDFEEVKNIMDTSNYGQFVGEDEHIIYLDNPSSYDGLMAGILQDSELEETFELEVTSEDSVEEIVDKLEQRQG